MRSCVIPPCQFKHRVRSRPVPWPRPRRCRRHHGSQQTQEARWAKAQLTAPCQAQDGPGTTRPSAAAVVVGAGVAVGTTVAGASAAPNTVGAVSVPATSPASSWAYVPPTATPIKHVVVIFDENVSFDHYFGTYPNATNTDGSTFHAKPGTPEGERPVHKITRGPDRPAADQQPERVQPAAAHPLRGADLRPEPRLHAGAGGLRRRQDGHVRPGHRERLDLHRPARSSSVQPGLVMDYYDGNTVTGLWNYAQNYAMSDNNYDTDFGPVHPRRAQPDLGQRRRRLRGQTRPRAPVEPTPGSVSALNSAGLGTIYGDLDPAYDDCSDSSHTSTSPLGVMTGKNIGDLLNARPRQLGLVPGRVRADRHRRGGYAVCGSTHDQHRRHLGHGLLAAPQPVPVLQVHGQPQAPAADLGGGHRPHRPGQPPVRPV